MLQAVFDLDHGPAGPRSGFVGTRSPSPTLLRKLIGHRRAFAIARSGARLAHHDGEHAGEDKRRQLRQR